MLVVYEYWGIFVGFIVSYLFFGFIVYFMLCNVVMWYDILDLGIMLEVKFYFIIYGFFFCLGKWVFDIF